MATCYISEYANQAFQSGHPVVMWTEPSLVDQTVPIGGAHNESLPFSMKTRQIRVNVDAPCSIVIGDSPVATTANKRLAGNQTEGFFVTPGHKLSVIANV